MRTPLELAGARELLVLAAALLLIIITLATGYYELVGIVATTYTAYIAWRTRFRVLELVHRDRVGLLLSAHFRLAPSGDHLIITLGKRERYLAFIRVRDCDPPQSLGRAAERAVAALHALAATVTIHSVLQGGSYRYYIGVCGSRRDLVRQAITSIHRALLGAGVYIERSTPGEALSALGLRELSLGPAVPVLTIAAIALAAACPLAPWLLLALPPLIPLAYYELRVARGGVCYAAPRMVKLAPTFFALDEVAVGSIVRSAATILHAVPSGAVVACLAPADPAQVEAKARAAFEVLDAARAGVGKLTRELEAQRMLLVWKRLQEGAAPFRASAYATLELGREMITAGFRTAYAPRHEVLAAALGLSSGSLLISHQLAWLAPHAFLRPRTRRTPKAVYLGRGLRRDEEVWLELDELDNVHGLIVGPMGSGKSTTARTLALRALERGITPIFIDPSGEYRAFAQRFGFEVVDLWDRQLDISRTKSSDLLKAFDYLSPLSDGEYLLLRRALEGGGLWELPLPKLEVVREYFERGRVSAHDLLGAGKPFVLCMGSTSGGRYVAMPEEVQRFAFTCLLGQLRDYAIERGLSEPEWLLIVDEGHMFMFPPRRSGEPPVVTVARMLRKFGLAVVVVTHDWADVSDVYIRHCGWKLAMSHSDPRYVSDTEYYLNLRPEERTWFSRGLQGRAVLRRSHEPHNVLVEVEPVDEARTDFWARS